jgi:hypothetical protein
VRGFNERFLKYEGRTLFIHSDDGVNNTLLLRGLQEFCGMEVPL